MISEISIATKRNWEKLGTDSTERLTKRANKRLSKKKFVPIEYFSDTLNISIVQKIIDDIEEKKYTTEDVIYSLAYLLLSRKGIANKPHVIAVLSDYSFKYIPQIETYVWPFEERDLLGVVYQSLLFEGDKNQKGSYYTPASVAENMVCNLEFDKNQLFLDPCCGSGSFLLALNAEDPRQLYGVDKDFLAVFIAKINLLIKYNTEVFIPHIECADYLSDLFSTNSTIPNTEFDYIVTNPPWGALSEERGNISEITSKETFSYFFVKTYKQLKPNGKIRFLLPKAILNVKVHKDIRTFILEKTCLEAFTLYDGSFMGVTTKYIDVLCSKNTPSQIIKLHRGRTEEIIPVSSFYETENTVFNFLTTEDMKIMAQVKNAERFNLSNSIWALGIVTGDNKNKLFSEPKDGMEAIYTGKEIAPYLLKEPRNYLLYDRKQLQQVAKEEYYRAEEKLVYKFISNKLTFAYDNQQRLFLNSANILIPKVPGMNTKTVMAFLNSELYQFLYLQMFGEEKILKGNLIELPLPEISKEQDVAISNLVDLLILGNNCKNEIQKYIYDIFDITTEQINYIRRTIYGTTA